jgi:hypothetical protein
MREHPLGQGLSDLVDELPERGPFGAEVPMEGARRHSQLCCHLFHLGGAPWPE